MKRAHIYHRVFIYLAVLVFFSLYILDTVFNIFKRMNPIILLTVFSWMLIPIFATKIKTRKKRMRVAVYSLLLTFLLFYFVISPMKEIWAATSYCTSGGDAGTCFTTYNLCVGICGNGFCDECNRCYNTCSEHDGQCTTNVGCDKGTNCGSGNSCVGGSCTSTAYCSGTDHCVGSNYWNGYHCNGGTTCNVDAGLLADDSSLGACEDCPTTGADQTTNTFDLGINYWSGETFQTGTDANCCGEAAGEWSLVYRWCNTFSNTCQFRDSDWNYKACCNQQGACVNTANTCWNNGVNTATLRCYNYCFWTCNDANIGVNSAGTCCAGETSNEGWSTSPSAEDAYNCFDGKDNDCDDGSEGTDETDDDCCVDVDGDEASTDGNCVGSPPGNEWNPTNEASNCRNNKWLIDDVDEGGIAQAKDIDDVWIQDDGYTLYVMVSTFANKADTFFYVYFDVDEDGSWDCRAVNVGAGDVRINAGATNCGNVGIWSIQNTQYTEYAINIDHICLSAEGCCETVSNACTGTTGQMRVAVSSNAADYAPNSGNSPNYAEYSFNCGGPENPIPEFLFGAVTALVILLFILGLARRQRILVPE